MKLLWREITRWSYIITEIYSIVFYFNSNHRVNEADHPNHTSNTVVLFQAISELSQDKLLC